MTWSITFYWWLLDDITLTAAAMILLLNLAFLTCLMWNELKQVQPYTLRKIRMPKSHWIKAYLKWLPPINAQWITQLCVTMKRTKQTGYPLAYK